MNPASRESLSKLKVHGRSGDQRRPLDMLEEYLITTEAFLRVDPRFRSISPDDAFRVLEKAYVENKPKFLNAATANDSW